MATPFNIDIITLDFAGHHYPPINALKRAISISKTQSDEIIRIYFTEGIPYAFINHPILFENIRSWLGRQLNVHAKCITLTGSARIGYSLNPRKIGKEFSTNSDLDLIIVDESLFNALGRDFIIFTEDLLKQPKKYSGRKYQYYVENVLTINRSIEQGYIDQWQLPDIELLTEVSTLYGVLRLLLRRMGNTTNCPQPPKASIRVFKNWEACVNRISVNVFHALTTP